MSDYPSGAPEGAGHCETADSRNSSMKGTPPAGGSNPLTPYQNPVQLGDKIAPAVKG